tara:strand:- start:41599 stop:42153 length:555 start_codon:yes stop_codon:yes gene_type:complete
VIENLNDLHNLLFKELNLTFHELENSNLMSELNPDLLDYAMNFGSSIPKNNHQDHLEIQQNRTNSELTNFISENSGNWNIAVHKKTNELYTNEHWLYTESNLSDYRKLNFGIEECLISFSLQELYFAFCENEIEVKSELNLIPIWTDKRYSSKERTHSFLYDSEFKALKFIHSENNFEKIAFIE